MKVSEADIIRAALLWWQARRPDGFTESDHIGTPLIKRIGAMTDEVLALACAKYTEIQAKKKKRRSAH